MENRIPAYIRALGQYSPGKNPEEIEREFGVQNVIKLPSTENPMGSSPSVREAILKASLCIDRYPDSEGSGLRSDLATLHQTSLDEICLGNGSNELIDLLAKTVLTAEDHAIAPRPSFPCYAHAVRSIGASCTEVPLAENFEWNVDALLGSVTSKTKLLFVGSPNNPTGTYLGRAALERLVSLIPANTFVIVDEAYIDFADASDSVSALGLLGTHPNVVVLRTFSKVYGLAGLRVGYAVGDRTLMKYLQRVRAPFNVNVIAQEAARAALRDRDYVDRYIAMNKMERERVKEALQALGLGVTPSQANFLLVELGRNAAAVYEQLIFKGVIVRLLPPPLESYVRISLGLPRENDQLLSSLRAVLGR